MKKKWQQGLIIILALLLSSCASGPDLSNSPQNGGLFGGIKGITQGDYEARVSQKEDTLSMVKRSNESIEKETAGVTSGQRETQKKIAELKPKLVSLNIEIKDLSSQIAALEQQGTADPEELEALKKIASALEVDMNSLDKKANQLSPHYEQLLAQKKQLEEEYQIAINIFLLLNGS